jgi:hypothetical protein
MAELVEYIVVEQFMWMTERRHFRIDYHSDLKHWPSRQQAVAHGSARQLPSDNLYIATLRDGRVVAYGTVDKDLLYPAAELDEIGRQLAIEVSRG